jgi:hypothetical protein
MPIKLWLLPVPGLPRGSVSNLLGAQQRAENARELLADKSPAAVDQMRAHHKAEVASTAGSARSG